MDRAQMQEKLDQLIWRVEQARIKRSEHHIVKIVAVSKYTDEAHIRMLYDLGQRAFGENKVQSLQERIETADDLPIEWHFIGRLQKNKINHLIRANPFLMQSLDSLELAEAMQKRLKHMKPIWSVYSKSTVPKRRPKLVLCLKRLKRSI